jgi:hypothetical protein
MRDVELEPRACGVQTESHVRVVAGLVDGVVVHGEVVGGSNVVVASGVKELKGVVGRVEDVEFPSEYWVNFKVRQEKS